MWGCEKIELHPQNNQNHVNPTSNSDNDYVLGKYKGISFSIKNMKKSLVKFGYNSKADELEANAYYCVVYPDKPEDVQFIDTSSDICVLEYPIEFEILEQGDYYIPEGVTDTFYSPRYVVVDDLDVLPDQLNLEIKETLHYPENEQEAEAYLYNQLLFGETQLPEGVDTAEYIEDNKAGWYPNIYVYYKTDNNIDFPIKNMKISIGIFNYVTDENGKVTNINKHYGQINVSGFFKNDILTVREGLVEFTTIDRYDIIKKDISKQDQKIDLFIDKNHLLWKKATIFVAARRYNDFCNTTNIQKAENLNVWILNLPAGSGGAPLFRTLGGFEFVTIKSFLAMLAGIPFTDAFITSLIVKNLSPDIVIKPQTNTKSLERAVFHELSHFSHGKKRGQLFWNNIIVGETSNYIDTGEMYGDGTSPNQSIAEKIGIAEGWAYFQVAKIMNSYYNNETSMENFQPRTIPSITGAGIGWDAAGVYWDLLDNSPGEPVIKLFNINGIEILKGYDTFNGVANGITISKLYNIITNSNCNSIQNFKTLFNNQYPNLETQNNALFLLYGY